MTLDLVQRLEEFVQRRCRRHHFPLDEANPLAVVGFRQFLPQVQKRPLVAVVGLSR
jgi:hypothetical protein